LVRTFAAGAQQFDLHTQFADAAIGVVQAALGRVFGHRILKRSSMLPSACARHSSSRDTGTPTTGLDALSDTRDGCASRIV
jgi:hypothetical protein